MIYLVSDNIDATGDDIKKLTVDESLDIIAHWPVVQFDTETTGFDPHVCSLTSMQFGYKHFDSGDHTEIVIDCTSINPKNYKEVIESQYLIGHNLKFDLQFLYNYDIVPLNVYDTMICEQLLYLGYKPGSVSFALGSVLNRRVGIDLDKSYQKQIATKGLTYEGIVYAANDVRYLQDIRKSQLAVAKERNCEKAFTVENRFVPAIAYLEWCGIRMDKEKWGEKMKSDLEKRDDYLNKLNDFILSDENLKKKFVSSYTQLSLFDTETVSSPVDINWNSSTQVVPVLQELGFNTEVRDKKTKKIRHSADKKNLQFQTGINDEFLDLYKNYSEAQKVVSSYGQNYLNLINPNTDRLHTKFSQLGTVTGRMSSGSSGKNIDLAKLKKLPENEVGFVNLQNLPARGDEGVFTRSCFIASEGNAFVSCDYSAEESRVQADVWNEKSLLDSFEKGIDTHNLYAKLCFPEELKNVDVRDVKKVRPDLRQAAKSAEFALGYGSDGSAIAKSIGMSEQKAREMVAGILKGMPGMAAFKKKTIKFLKQNGYIVINPITGHRIYWQNWATWRAQEDRFDRTFWDNYIMYHKGTNDSVAQMVASHNELAKNWFEKNVLNYPIQGGSAIVLKQAAADLFKWIVDNGYFNKILFCVLVHDEIDCECPKEIADDFSKVMTQIMEKAARKYYKKLKIPAEASVSEHWVH